MTPALVLPKFKGIDLSNTSIPPEVLFHILRHLEDPRDLYRASLTSRSWRNAGMDDRLWQLHYWRFYRPFHFPKLNGDDTVEQLLRQRERVRREAMLAWLQQASTSPPTVELFELRSGALGKAKKEWDDLRTRSPPPGVSKEKHDEAIDSAARKLKWLHYLQRPAPIDLNQGLTAPHFLAALSSDEDTDTTNGSSFPSFCRLFASQMSADEALLRELREYVDLNGNTLHRLLAIIANYGHAARPLLAALCATQRFRSDNMDLFLPREDGAKVEDTSWPRAFELHTIAREGKTHPQGEHCLALCHAARQALKHLQRQEALLLMQDLQDRRRSFDLETFPTLKECVTACCLGLEEANESLALFRSGSRVEVSEYLDLLALFVSADLQAEDRRTAVDEGKRKWGLQPDAKAHPLGSSRYKMMRVVDALLNLGFVMASAADQLDYDNPFINVVLNCPAQRPTISIMQASIICAVARRLGIAAAVSKSALHTLIIAIEEGDQPATWRPDDEDRDWQRFFVSTSMLRKSTICEVQDVRRFLASKGVPLSQQDALLEPASPTEILARLAHSLTASVEAERGDVTRLGGRGRYPAEDEVILDSAAPHQLGRLRLYLEGRQREPPAPLLPAVLASSLDPLPSTKKHDPRDNPLRLPVDTKYCALWISRIVAPQQVGGLERANDLLAEMISNITSMYTCDYILLMQLDRTHKVKSAAASTGAGHVGQPVTEDNGSKYYAEHFAHLVEYDSVLGCGLGCAGGASEKLRQARSGTALPRRLIDRAFPSNSEVRFGVGAVVQHLVFGWKGVIVGWDKECRSSEGFIAQHGVDNFPNGGRSQPFYQIITAARLEAYEPQCQLKPVLIPTGATREQAARILRSLLRMLTDVEIYGKVFRTLRVAPWDDKKEEEEEGKKGEGSVVKSKSKLKKEARKAAKLQMKKNGREPEKGQVYLVTNRWMKEAWPYG